MKLDRFINRPVLSTVISVLIVILGIIGLATLPVTQYPDIAPPTVQVRATYTGANSTAVLNSVIAPLEDQINGVENMMYIQSSASNNGAADINVYFNQGTDPDMAAVNVQNRVSMAQGLLPAEVTKVGVTTQKRQNSMLMVFSLYDETDSYNIEFIENYANINLIPEIKRVKGVGDANVLGQDYSMRIWLKPDVMAQYKLVPTDVSAALAEQNIEAAPGQFGERGNQTFQYTIRYKGRLQQTTEFEDIVIKALPDGNVLRLGDVADIELGRLAYTFNNMVNGHKAVSCIVYQMAGSNATETISDLEKVLAKAQESLPTGLNINIAQNANDFLFASIHEVIKTLIEAFILVFIVVYIFLQDMRSTLIPAIAIPVALVATFFVLKLIGFSVNLLTLSAMVLAIAIVVDDAIVVLENVERLMTHEGLGPFEAAQKAMREVASALVAIVLVLCAVFVPVAFLGGMAGELYKQFAVTVAVSVAISGFVALTLTPALCAVILKKEEPKKGRFFTAFNKGLSKLTFGYLQCVKWALHWRSIAAVVLIAVTVACWQMIERTPTSFVPSEDQGILRMTMTLPEGASFARTRAESDAMRQKIQAELPGLDTVLVMTGFDTQGGDIRPNAATFIIKLKNWNDRTISADEVLAKLRIIGATSKESVTVASLPAPIRGLGSSSGFSGYIQSRGSDDALMLQRVTEDFLARLAERPELTGLRHFVRAESPLIQVDLDDVKASQLGITSDNVYSTLTAFFAGSYINNYTRNGRIYRVIMQGEDRYRLTPEDLSKVWVRSDTTGEMVPLSAVLTVKRTSGPESLARMNGYLAAQFMGSAVQGVSSGEAIRIVEETAQEYLPEGYAVEWTGQAWQEKRIGASSTTAFIFGMIIVFLILAALYERWSLPIAVVLAVPFAVLGALVSLWIRGFSNDIYFQIGLLVLIGLSAKNAILIVEFAAQKMHEGLSPFDAAIEAAGLRLRPILMTSLAFVMGIVPLVFATGAGAGARHSMGTGVFGGMIAATFIATIFVPVFFTWFVKRKKAPETVSHMENEPKKPLF